jgi:hypothetical protein
MFCSAITAYVIAAETTPALKGSPSPGSPTKAAAPKKIPDARAVPCIDLQEPAVEQAAVDRKFRWQKKELKVVFLDGSKSLQEKVIRAAKEWEEPSGLRFNFGAHADSDVRVSFAHEGHYSHIGTLALRIDKNEHTMNLEFTDGTPWVEVKMIALHEFGHALGLIHEHQSPASGIKWNEAEVMAYYQGPPNYWDVQTIYSNVLEKYQKTQTMRTSVFDRRSIMLYPIQKRFTQDGFSSDWNEELSPIDREFIRDLYKDVSATGRTLDIPDWDERIAAITR